MDLGSFPTLRVELDFGQREEILDQVEQPMRVTVDDSQHLGLVRRERWDAVGEQLHITDHAGERCPQLVGNGGDEIRLDEIEFDELGDCCTFDFECVVLDSFRFDSFADVEDLGDEIRVRECLGADDGDCEVGVGIRAIGPAVALVHIVVVVRTVEQLLHVLQVVVEIVWMGDVLERERTQILLIAAEELTQGVVDGQEPTVMADECHANGGVREREIEQLAVPTSLGDVHERHQYSLRIVRNRRRRQAEEDPLIVTAGPTDHLRVDPFTRGEGAHDRPVGVGDLGSVLAERLPRAALPALRQHLRVETQDPLRRGVHEFDHAVPACHDHALLEQVQGRALQLFELPQQLLGRCELGHVRETRDRTAHRMIWLHHRSAVHPEPAEAESGALHTHQHVLDRCSGTERLHCRVCRAGPRGPVGADCFPAGIHRRAPAKFVAGESEHPFGGLVPFDDASARVLQDESIVHRRQNLRLARFTALQLDDDRLQFPAGEEILHHRGEVTKGLSFDIGQLAWSPIDHAEGADTVSMNAERLSGVEADA